MSEAGVHRESFTSAALAGATAGSLARCVHVGSFPASSKLGGTTIGTNDPARWQYLLWFDGQFWATELKHDVMRDIPSSFEELKSHFERWHGSGQSPWKRVAPQNIPGA